MKEKNVVLSNKIIRANQKLNVTEKRIISYCVSEIKRDDRHQKSMLFMQDFLERRKFYISVDVFATLYDYKNKNNAYRDLKKAAKSLFERSAQIRFEDQEDYVRFVDRVKYTNNGVELFFTPDIYFHLFEFEGNFTQYNLRIGTSFKSIYAHRIFELLQSRKDTNCIVLTEKEFRFMLDIPDSYKTYAKIQEKVFEPTIKEFQKFGMTLDVNIKKGDNTILTISTNKNVNDIVRELGLCEENKLNELNKLNEKKVDFSLHCPALLEMFPFFTVEDFEEMPEERLLLYIEQLKKTV